MQPATTLSHDQLLTLANKTRAAALDAETDRLEATAQRLLEALVEHFCAEHVALLQLPPGETRALERGQQRLLTDLAELVELATTAARPQRSCDCARLAGNVLAELTLQTGVERRRLTAVVDRQRGGGRGSVRKFVGCLDRADDDAFLVGGGWGPTRRSHSQQTVPG
jgi:hypothetical protein